MIKLTSLFAGTVVLAGLAPAADFTVHTWKKHHLSDLFWSEGASLGDFNHDGTLDVVSGPYWWEGPEYKVRHEYYPATKTWKLGPVSKIPVPGYEGALGRNNAYSDNFFAFTGDINKDGWDDIIIYGFPGAEAFWYENPKGKPADGSGHWKKHVMIEVVDNESPAWVDITGDGKPEIVCSSQGFYGYATPDPADPYKPWIFHKISPNNNYHKFTHGLGVGDVNGDGRMDLIEKSGWWEQPSSLNGDTVWKYRAVPFAPTEGSSQMFAYDVNGDGLPDVITALAAHNYGLAWYEQLKEKNERGEPKFQMHLIVGKTAKENKYGVVFSQPHAVDFVDMDGDGLKDIVTGKRFWAHGATGDSDPNGAAVLYWFKLVRGADGRVDWVPYLIDSDSGVGTQVLAADANGDGLPDVVVGNKKGTFVHLHGKRQASEADWKKAQPQPKN